MKTLARILFPLVIGLLGCKLASNGTNTNAGDPKLTDTRARDAADIKTLEERFTTAFRAKDVNAIMQLCVPDDSLVVFDVQPPREVKGRAAYRKDWEDAFNSVSGPLEVENSDMDVTSGGDIAYVHYINHVVGTMKDGKKANFTVRVTDCLKKINGVWLIAHSHVSVPVDTRTGEADMQSKP